MHTLSITVGLALLAFGLVSNARAEGIEYVVEIQTNDLATSAEVANAQTVSLDVIRKRLGRLGLDGSVEAEGQTRILVRLFGLRAQDKERARQAVSRSAFLEFRLVHPDSEKLLADGLGAPGYEILQLQQITPDGSKAVERLLVKRPAERGLKGTYIKSALVTRGSLREPEIDFELNEKGAQLFAEVTRDNIGRRLAIVLDGELYSAPVIRGAIPGGRGQITGHFDLKEAFEFASVMENPLPARLNIIEERSVDPSVENAHLRRNQLRSALVVGGALAIIGVVIGVIVLIVRAARRQPVAVHRATTLGPPPLPPPTK